jgi:tetratricopeptide (TPR) repeat protein
VGKRTDAAGHHAFASGDIKAARAAWDKMLADYSGEWLTQLCYGEAMIYLEDEEKAVKHLKQVAALQPKPRNTDAYDTIAQLALIRSDKKAAATAYEKALDIIKTEWQMGDTQMAEDLRRKIISLR